MNRPGIVGRLHADHVHARRLRGAHRKLAAGNPDHARGRCLRSRSRVLDCWLERVRVWRSCRLLGPIGVQPPPGEAQHRRPEQHDDARRRCPSRPGAASLLLSPALVLHLSNTRRSAPTTVSCPRRPSRGQQLRPDRGSQLESLETHGGILSRAGHPLPVLAPVFSEIARHRIEGDGSG